MKKSCRVCNRGKTEHVHDGHYYWLDGHYYEYPIGITYGYGRGNGLLTIDQGIDRAMGRVV